MQYRTLTTIAIWAAATVAPTTAAVIDGKNWADAVTGYSSKIQNYGGTLLSTLTEWWLIGPSDADVNGNGYAWDADDQDTVAGWRANAPGEYITIYWETALPDVTGNDLVIHMYGGPNAAADLFASTNGDSYIQIGTIGGGTPGYFRDEAFDFGGLFGDGVHYVKVVRVANGPNTGIFFDSFAGTVPEPATLALLGCGACVLIRRRDRG